jgi:two-component system CheB/CheR fusion protein
VIRVLDTGTGIAPEILPTIFDLFVQDKRALDRAPGGLGIGLTVVRRIVELHAGRVEVHSDGVGKGAEFVVRLPASTLLDATAAAPEPSAQRPPARVLLIEDNADAAEGMMMLLELKGHRVEVAHDGTSGIALAALSAPDVLLVDIGLPGIDGYEVARRVRRNPRLAHVVLVALTGYGRAEDKRRAFEAGFDHHLTKPIALDALNALMAKV